MLLFNLLASIYLGKHLLYQPILDVGYVLLGDCTTCHHYASYHADINSAEEECSHNSGCGGILDPWCTNDGFVLCSIGTITDDNNNWCVYEKTGNSYLYILILIREYISIFFIVS